MALWILARLIGAVVLWFVCFLIFGLMVYDPSLSGSRAATVCGAVCATIILGAIFAMSYWDHGKEHDEKD